MLHEEPYPGLTCWWYRTERGGTLRGASTGAAWLSSARAVRCPVKSGNERNPCPVLQVSQETAGVKPEEGGDDVKSAWPLCPGLHTRYNGRDNG